MKGIRFLSMMMLVALLLPLMTACGGDDELSTRQQLVGLWKTSMSSSNWKYIKLLNNGGMYYGSSAEYIDYEVTSWISSGPNGTTSGSTVGDKKAPNAHWSYNESAQTISMYTDDGYYSFTYRVSMANDAKSWAGYNEKSGTTYSFIRME